MNSKCGPGTTQSRYELNLHNVYLPYESDNRSYQNIRSATHSGKSTSAAKLGQVYSVDWKESCYETQRRHIMNNQSILNLLNVNLLAVFFNEIKRSMVILHLKPHPLASVSWNG